MTKSNAQVIYEFLRSQGYSDAQTAGIMGNLQTESNFDTTASGDGGAAIGIAQWEGGRRANLQALAASRGTDETDLQTQLVYLMQELAGPYSTVNNEVKRSNDPAYVARIWDVGVGGVNSGTGFENSAGLATDLRMSRAMAFDALFSRGQEPTGSVTTSPTTSDNGGTGMAGTISGGTAHASNAGWINHIPILGTAVSWTESLGKILGDFLNPKWWERVGIFLLGAALVLGAIVLTFRSTEAGKAATTLALSEV